MTPDRTDARLTELEIKLAFTEDLLEKLDEVVISQQRRIDALIQELASLREQVARTDSSSGGSPRDDRPPHY
jgi:SlyX protein